MQQGFGKACRLLTPGDFQRVFQRASFRLSSPGLVVLAREQALQHARLGLVMARRHCHRAVDRNRIKRIVRESFRTRQHTLGSYDFIVMARKGVDKIPPAVLHAEIARLWDDARAQPREVQVP